MGLLQDADKAVKHAQEMKAAKDAEDAKQRAEAAEQAQREAVAKLHKETKGTI